MILKWYIGGEYFVTVRGKLVPLAVMMMMICIRKETYMTYGLIGALRYYPLVRVFKMLLSLLSCSNKEQMQETNIKM